MNTTPRFVDNYFEMWSTPDPERRHELVESLFAPQAIHYAAPADVSFVGHEAIEANISRVNRENLQEAGLLFDRGDHTLNHDSVHVRWQVTTPGGAPAATGQDFLLLDSESRITRLYMFIGQ